MASTAAEAYADHDAYVDGLVAVADNANESAAVAAVASEEAAAAAADAAPAAESARVVVFNPATGGVITEGGELLVESTFTDTGGMRLEIPTAGGDYTEAAAEAEDAAAEAEDAVAAVRAAAVEAQMAALAAAAEDADEAATAAAEVALEEWAEAQVESAAAQAAAEAAETARLAEAATVTVSADGTQQFINDANGFTATAITSDTGVLITMDAEPLQAALENLTEGEIQPVLAVDGVDLVASWTADGEVDLFNTDGSDALDADGEPYTVDDLVAMRLIFSLR
jgi:hypothetical protein